MNHTARRLLAAATAVAALAAGLAVLPGTAQAAAPDPATLPTTVAADALPTVQVNGVVWDQAIRGTTVYAVGNFTSARPAGSPAGTNETPRKYMLAYDLRTGELIRSFNAYFNSQVQSVSIAPDGSAVYVGGQFTTANGQPRNRVAALDPATGAPLAGFAPDVNSQVIAVEATAGAVYIGGSFTSVNGTARNRAAGLDPATGALNGFAPNVADLAVRGIVANGAKIAIGGSFTAVNGSSRPGYGLALLDASDGRSLPLAANTTTIRNGGRDAAIYALKGDADGFYGGGYHFGDGGTIEGTFMADWDGNLTFVEDCHGDTYDVAPVGRVLYAASHHHYCGNLGTGGFPQTEPWSFYRATATTKFATGTATTDPYEYPDHTGEPTPTLLNFFPSLAAGTFTGATQAAWDVTATSDGDYVLYGGEFPAVNGVAQQGLVRFASRAIAPNKVGPKFSAPQMDPTVTNLSSGRVRVAWPANWDRDDQVLEYRIFRNDMSTLVHRETQNARFWEGRPMAWTDTGLTPGTAVRYRVQTADPAGNVQNSAWVTVTVGDTDVIGDYGRAVLADGATRYWRLDETDAAVRDWAGVDDTTAGAGVTRGTSGALLNSTNGAATFSGNASGIVPSTELIEGPNTFSHEVWFRTATRVGGKIMGFGSAQSGNSDSYDRHLYMNSSGRLLFGVYANSTEYTVQSPNSYNDGQWHQAVTSLGPNGMNLYVDGKRVAGRADATRGERAWGYWRLGGDVSWSGAAYFTGAIDDFSSYEKVLTPQQVNAHWMASGRTSALKPAPSDAYGKLVHGDEPSLYWRLAESGGTTAVDASINGVDGTYAGKYTLGRPGVVTGDTAVNVQRPRKFLGMTTAAGGTIVSKSSFADPRVFSQEAWIRTDTTTGGRILGFGTSSSGSTSSITDRMLYMLNGGRVRFGVNNGTNVTIDSSAALNDNQWHHLVATVGPDGMRLYVDGRLDAAHPNTVSRSYTGYWKVGGDATMGGSTDTFFLGDVDEVAVYPRALDRVEVEDHFLAGGGTLPNAAPQAAFSHVTSGLEVTFTSTSTDADGAIASYAWDFGDGSTSSERNPAHSFAASGTYGVSLTVTDNRGATSTVNRLVSVTAPNVAPKAGFSAEVSDLAVAFRSTSTDADGAIASYAWDFGDGETSSVAAPSHTYASAGEKTVRLTVTDDRGGTDTVTRTVTVRGANVAPKAGFSAEVSGRAVAFRSTSTDADGAIASYAWDFGDGETSSVAAPSHTYASAGEKTVRLTVTDDRGGTDTVTRTVTVSDANVAPKAAFSAEVSDLAVAFRSTSTDADGTIASYAWDFGDGETSSVAAPSHTYASAGEKTVRLTVTDDRGATDTVTRTVTVTARVADVLAADTFSRTTTGSWGTADTGGGWTLGGAASLFTVADGTGTIRMASGGSGTKVTLGSVSSTATDVRTSYGVDTIANGGGVFLSIGGRVIGTNDYRLKVKIGADGTQTLYLVRLVNNAETTIAATTLGADLAYTSGVSMRARLQVTGTSPTTVRAKVWKAGADEPTGWTLSRTDSTAGLQAPGAIGLAVYLASSATNGPIRGVFDDLVATPAG